ncbi:hypothetical protein D5F11_011295 [Siminovitchia terrae]|uniref:Uncharacterized protein n=1 Tax=Siminovitchia terrae TaxID=1914933 RepID=A0A429X8U4_SIMTE|nr:hypothetical protein [Siminovitchia terrae]RST59681.1 hypothetical protein D5F11_011295 [Siminovitchia terrae]
MLVSARDYQLVLELIVALERLVEIVEHRALCQIISDLFGSYLAFYQFMSDLLGVEFLWERKEVIQK